MDKKIDEKIEVTKYNPKPQKSSKKRILPRPKYSSKLRRKSKFKRINPRDETKERN